MIMPLSDVAKRIVKGVKNGVEGVKDSVIGVKDGVIGGTLHSLGESLVGDKKSINYILGETSSTYEAKKFLTKKEAKDILRILEEFKNNKDLTKAIDGHVGGYFAYTSSIIKKVILLLKNYIKFWGKFEKSMQSIPEAQKFKDDLIRYLEIIRDAVKSSDADKYSMNSVVTAAIKKGEKPKSNADGHMTVVDYLWLVLRATAIVSLDNLNKNDPNECAIFIGDSNDENGGFKLNYSLLGMHEEKVVIKKGLPTVVDKKGKLVEKISKSNIGILKKLRDSSGEKLKKAEEILKKAVNKLAELNSHTDAKLRSDEISEKINKCEEIKNNIKAIVSGAGDTLSLRNLYQSLNETNNIPKSQKLCEDSIKYFEKIEIFYKKILNLYKETLDSIKSFEEFMSTAKKQKKNATKKYIPVIEAPNQINILRLNPSLKLYYDLSKLTLEFFSGGAIPYMNNDLSKELSACNKTDRETKLKNSYEFIENLYNVILKLKKLYETYTRIGAKRFEEPYYKVIKIFTDKLSNFKSEDVLNGNLISVVEEELRESKKDSAYIDKYFDEKKKLENCAKKHKKMNEYSKLILNTEDISTYDRKSFRECLDSVYIIFSTKAEEWENEYKNKRIEGLNSSKNPLKKLAGKALGRLSSKSVKKRSANER